MAKQRNMSKEMQDMMLSDQCQDMQPEVGVAVGGRMKPPESLRAMPGKTK